MDKSIKETLKNLSRMLPEGYAIVPCEPTELMLEDGMQYNHQHNGESNVIETFKAMCIASEYEIWRKE